MNNKTVVKPQGLFPVKSDGNEVGLRSSFQSFVHKNLIGHFRNGLGGGGGVDCNTAIAYGIVTGDTICLFRNSPRGLCES